MPIPAKPTIYLESKKMENQNFGLSEAEFHEMVEAMRNGDTVFFERVYLSHFENCINYLIGKNHSIYWKKYEQAYTATMQALLEIRRELIEGKIAYGNLRFYFTKRAKMKLYKITKKAEVDIDILDRDFKKDQNFLDAILSRELSATIKKALAKLGGKCQRLIQMKYGQGLTWLRIAVEEFLSTSITAEEAKYITIAVENLTNTASKETVAANAVGVEKYEKIIKKESERLKKKVNRSKTGCKAQFEVILKRLHIL